MPPACPTTPRCWNICAAKKARGRMSGAGDRRRPDHSRRRRRPFADSSTPCIASDGMRNLKGEHKAAALAERLGEKGFVYAGNDRSDLSVWRRARAGVIVNASRGVAASAAQDHRGRDGISPEPARPCARWCKRAAAPPMGEESSWCWCRWRRRTPCVTQRPGSAPRWTFAAFCCVASGDLYHQRPVRPQGRPSPCPQAQAALRQRGAVSADLALRCRSQPGSAAGGFFAAQSGAALWADRGLWHDLAVLFAVLQGISAGRHFRAGGALHLAAVRGRRGHRPSACPCGCSASPASFS